MRQALIKRECIFPRARKQRFAKRIGVTAGCNVREATTKALLSDMIGYRACGCASQRSANRDGKDKVFEKAATRHASRCGPIAMPSISQHSVHVWWYLLREGVGKGGNRAKKPKPKASLG